MEIRLIGPIVQIELKMDGFKQDIRQNIILKLYIGTASTSMSAFIASVLKTSDWASTALSSDDRE